MDPLMNNPMAFKKIFKNGTLNFASYPGKTFVVIKTSAAIYGDVAADLEGVSDRGTPVLHTTLASALACTVANRGDVINVLPGHTETISTALALSTAGTQIVGHGIGDTRPTFTVNSALNTLNITGSDTKVVNLRFLTGSSVTAATRFIRVAASNVRIIGCQFEMTYAMYVNVDLISGDDIQVDNCNFVAGIASKANTRPQAAVLNRAGTNVLVINSRFNDFKNGGHKRMGWLACVEGGAVAGSTQIEKCTFVCRNIATRTRYAGASGEVYTIDCRGISPSGNTGVGSIFTPTYQYIIETYNVAAVNKVGVVTVTTSDMRLKTMVSYL